MSDRGNGFFGGLLMGAAMGFVLAILYAPEKGDKTRKRLAKKSEGWQEAATEAITSASGWVEKNRRKIGI